jgi:gamma-glutamylcyclotransferase (GGCT)/AIG2-like uncharacterized protein YtfP
MTLVFVYGTLKRGGGLHGVLQGADTAHVADGFVEGYALLDLGSFPGMVRGLAHDRVYGECYGVSPATLNQLDRVEAEGSLYDRKLVAVRTSHKRIRWAYAYIYRHPADQPVIDSGRWSILDQ